MDQTLYIQRHDKIAADDFGFALCLEAARRLSEHDLKDAEEKYSRRHSTLKREDVTWYSLPNLLRLLSIPAYLFLFASMIELLAHGGFKTPYIAFAAVASAIFCAYIYFWSRVRKREKDHLLIEMQAINAVKIERGDKAATMMQYITRENL